jgi:PAS domain S-box-containing protein
MFLKPGYDELLKINKDLREEIEALKSNNINEKDQRDINAFCDKEQKKILDEIFATVSHYMAIFSYKNSRFFIEDLNSKAEKVEFLNKEEVAGKCVEDTSLRYRTRLLELLEHIRISGQAHKLSVSSKDDDSEGFYMGFPLFLGQIMITWEPGNLQKSMNELYTQGVAFEKFADFLPEIIYEVDFEGRVRYGNRTGLKFFGLNMEDISKGLFIKDIFPEAYRQMLRNLRLLSSPDQIASNEYVARKKDGTRVPVITHSFATFLDNKVVYFRGVLTDISKQKEYETQIRREKAFLEHIYNSTPVALVITSSSGIISMINREFTTIFGFTSEESINRNIKDLIVPEDLKEESEIIYNLAANNKKETRQTIRQCKDGKLINVYLVSSTIEINNEIVAHLGIYRDITIERKSELLQEVLYNISNAALKQFDIKEIYPVIVQELNKLWDTNNFFIALYDKASETLSLPFFSDEKDNFYEIPVKNTITGWIIKQNASALLRERDLKLLEESGDIELVGTPCRVWMGVPLLVENEIIGVMCMQDYYDENKFSHDDLHIMEFIANQIAMTIQRRMMLDNLIRERQKAEDAAQSKQAFMSTMSHEIRTPLNEVIGITNLLLQGNPREDQMDFINTLKFSGNHLLTLVNDVLDYNKMESGKVVFEKIRFDLSGFLAEIMRSYSFRSKSKNLKFDIVKYNELPLEVIGDPLRLNQILSNLLSNALKFTKAGSISVTARELSRKGNESIIEFSVIDTGIGIAKGMQHRIFESFTQASPETAREFGGSGLGLSICKKIVELQGGKITFDSELGKGSTFRFVLPFGIPEKSSKPQSPDKPEDYSGLEGKRILVAEDNKINFFVANKFLSNWGVMVTHAENGQIALDILEKENFDLILMDLHMPVVDGIEATRIIRESSDPRIKNIPIVALTAAIMSESQDKIEDLKINDYILKPFKPSDLFERIRRNIR